MLEQRRPHWRKRKAKSASQFLSIFYILEREVLESQDEVDKKLFVEAFNSRDCYIEDVLHEFDTFIAAKAALVHIVCKYCQAQLSWASLA